ncbi:MAG: hypothetical protein M0R06_03805 [Sphaerochaeta sp.]|jgi:hypothetical protein|nr:hypothetical protein [Sphaerochaeta sp.]
MDNSEFQDGEALRDALVVEAKRLRETMGADTVSIVVTYEDAEGCTIRSAGGTGNWYAQIGALREMVVDDEERTREQARKHDAD